jgi:hypothetical protein
MARQTPIVIDPQDNPMRTPILAALPEEDGEEEGPALGMSGLPVSTGPLVVAPQVEAAEPAFFGDMDDAPQVDAPVAEASAKPVPVMVAVDEEDPWEDPPLRRSSGIPDWAPISAMVLCVLVSFVALADRLL